MGKVKETCFDGEVKKCLLEKASYLLHLCEEEVEKVG